MAVDQLVVLAPAEKLHGLVAVQLLFPLVHVDVQVLGGVVVAHVQRHVEGHAADGVHQLAHGLPLHHHVEVGDEAH